MDTEPIKKQKQKRNNKPEVIEALRERLANARAKRLEMKRLEKAIKQEEEPENPVMEEIHDLPMTEEHKAENPVKTNLNTKKPPKNSPKQKKKPFAKLIFYEKPDKDVKLRIGNKQQRQPNLRKQ